MSSRRRRITLASAVALVAGAIAWSLPAAPAGAAGPVTPVIVTIGFDDGTADQYAARTELNLHHMHATFFINSGFVGDPDHMDETQLQTLQAEGNEIGGHTIDHANIQPLSHDEQVHEVCDDKAALEGMQLTVTSFAYPFGSWDTATEGVVQGCGYTSARTVSGVSIHIGKNKVGETIPPADPFATRTPPNPKKATKLETMKQYVLNAESVATTSDPLWIQFVFHRYCEAHCGAYTIQPTKFKALLDFLQGEAGRVTVLTTAQAMELS
jgi:peptidoglycan/xylan/chitin deacetylase (PgdA/CDA1 family)